MNCTVTIDNGKTDGRFVSKGKLGFGAEGFTVFYQLDGDKCMLTYSGGRVVQERRGRVPMVMRFTQGKQTECTLGDGTNTGSFPVFTDKIEIKNDDKSVSVKLFYTLAGEFVTLSITAK